MRRIIVSVAVVGLALAIPATGLATHEVTETLEAETERVQDVTNSPPECSDASYEVLQGETYTVNPASYGWCSDSDDDALTFEVVSPPTHGQLEGPDEYGGFHYTAPTDYEGADSLTFRANDGRADSNIATLELEISDPASPHCLGGTSVEGPRDLDEGQSYKSGLNCYDDQRDPLTFRVSKAPEHGTIAGTSQVVYDDGQHRAYSYQFVYTPTPGYAGTDSWAVVANDGTQDSAPVEFAVVVHRNIVKTRDTGGAPHGEVSVRDDGQIYACNDWDRPVHGYIQSEPPSTWGAWLPVYGNTSVGCR